MTNSQMMNRLMNTYYITNNGFGHICEVLTKNQTLKKLNIGNNTQITSTTTSLLELYLQNTSLEDDNIMTICHTLTTNKTIERLVLSKKYKESCEKTEEIIQDRLLFL